MHLICMSRKSIAVLSPSEWRSEDRETTRREPGCWLLKTPAGTRIVKMRLQNICNYQCLAVRLTGPQTNLRLAPHSECQNIPLIRPSRPLETPAPVEGIKANFLLHQKNTSYQKISGRLTAKSQILVQPIVHMCSYQKKWDDGMMLPQFWTDFCQNIASLDIPYLVGRG